MSEFHGLEILHHNQILKSSLIAKIQLGFVIFIA
jgi:hypothetical protein